MKIRHRTVSLALNLGLAVALLGLLGLPLAATANQTNNWWTGLGDGVNWSDPANWSEDLSPDVNHIVRLGFADGGNVTNAPQHILVDTNATVWMLQLDATGERAVRLEGSTSPVPMLSLARPSTISAPVLEMVTAAAADVLIEKANLRYIGGGARHAYFNRSSRLLTFSNVSITTAGGGFETTQSGPYRFHNSTVGGWRARVSAPIFLDGFTAGGLSMNNYMHFRIQPGGANFSSFSEKSFFQRDGEGDRVLGIGQLSVPTSGNRSTANRSRDTLTVVETNAPGHLTIQVGGWSRSSQSPETLGPHIVMDANTTVELVSGGTGLMTFGGDGDERVTGLTGPGNMRLAMGTPAATFTVHRLMDYTGWTLLHTGTLVMASQTITSNSYSYTQGWMEIGVYPASMPTESPVTIAATAALRLHANFPQTIDSLSGEGEVQLRGSTLTVTNGVSPGMEGQIGDLTISDSGLLSIQSGTSRIAFADTETYDRLVFTGDADLMLGGVLEVSAPEGFYDIGVGRYPIAELNGGTPMGAFDAVIAPPFMTAKVEFENDNVILVLGGPPGTILLIR